MQHHALTADDPVLITPGNTHGAQRTLAQFDFQALRRGALLVAPQPVPTDEPLLTDAPVLQTHAALPTATGAPSIGSDSSKTNQPTGADARPSRPMRCIR